MNFIESLRLLLSLSRFHLCCSKSTSRLSTQSTNFLHSISLSNLLLLQALVDLRFRLPPAVSAKSCSETSQQNPRHSLNCRFFPSKAPKPTCGVVDSRRFSCSEMIRCSDCRPKLSRKCSDDWSRTFTQTPRDTKQQ